MNEEEINKFLSTKTVQRMDSTAKEELRAALEYIEYDEILEDPNKEDLLEAIQDNQRKIIAVTDPIVKRYLKRKQEKDLAERSKIRKRGNWVLFVFIILAIPILIILKAIGGV